MNQNLLSIVIPIYNEEKNLPLLYQELNEVLQELHHNKGYDYEMLMVNDGSSDGTLAVLKALKAEDSRIRILNMDKNRGEAAALTAGFQMAKGSIILSSDGDGQNDPRYLNDLVEKIEQGYQVATGYRLKRKEPLLKRKIPSMIANYLISRIVGLRVRDNGCSLKAYRAEIPKRVQIPHGFHRFIPVLFGVKDHEVCEVPVIDRPRLHGRSNYGLKRVPEVLRELVTIPFVLSDPEGYEGVFRKLFFLLAAASVAVLIWLISHRTWTLFAAETLLVFLTLLGGVIRDNLARFNRAQREGLFKVSEL